MELQFNVGLISANNGWAMAITGAIIVMCGLSILSFIISRLHKIIALFEGRAVEDAEISATGSTQTDLDLIHDLDAAAKLYKTISIELGEAFSLATLYAVANKENLPHTHITIRSLREAGYLVPAGDAKFSWKS